MKTINVAAIRIDGETQSRAEIHNDTVAEYADALESGTTFPPIIVFFDGVDYWLGDGFHRVHAFRQAGRASINADVREGTQSDAQLFSYGVNTDHGLRRTNADKRKAVTGALQHPVSCKWSDNQIAKHCGVSDKTVAAVRASHFGNSEVTKPTERTYTTKHGTTAVMNTENIGGKKKAGKAAPADTKSAPTAAPEFTPEEQEPSNDDGPTLAELVDELQAENTRLTAEITALAEADDQKAETLKWHRMYDHAMRRQSEAERSAASHQKDAKRLANQVRECCKALGLEDPRQLVPTVKKLAARREAA